MAKPSDRETTETLHPKTRMVAMGDDKNWVDLGVGPMIITAVLGDCVFATGSYAPDYSSPGGLPIPAEAAVFINTHYKVWARLAPGIVDGEVIVAPL